MLVIVRLHLKSAQEPTDTRQKFWSEYAKLSGLAAITPEQGEAKIKQTFLQLLSSQINSEIRRSRLRVRSRLRDKLTSFIRYGHLWVTHRRITIELIAIQYGSIEFVMNILGLDSETMTEKALDILALYSPVAFNQSLGGTATLTADVDSPITADFDSPISQKRAVAPLAVLGSSLLVPLIL